MADWPIYTPTSQSKPLDAILSQVGRGTIYHVADNTERADLLAALSAAGQPAPSASNPLYVHNASRPAGAELQSTINGTTWRTHDARDTGWQSLSLSSGFSGAPQARKIGPVVYLTSNLVRDAGPFTTTLTNCALVPVGMEPTSTVRIITGAPAGSNSGVVMQVTAGSRQIQVASLDSANPYGTLYLDDHGWVAAGE